MPQPNARGVQKKKRTRCSTAGCTTYAVARGVCVKHGANGVCSTAGCTANARARGVCFKHGSNGFCSAAGCTTSARARGLCFKHGANTVAATVATITTTISIPTTAQRDPDVTTGTPVQLVLADGSTTIAHILRQDNATGKYDVEYEDSTVIAPSTAIERGQLNLLTIEQQYQRQQLRRQIQLQLKQDSQ